MKLQEGDRPKFNTIIFQVIIYYTDIWFYLIIQSQTSSKKLINLGIKAVPNS